jgi:hypothetical protein
MFKKNEHNMIQPKESKSNSHFWISLFKSGLRFGACYSLFYGDLVSAAVLLAVAEILGVAEEIF